MEAFLNLSMAYIPNSGTQAYKVLLALVSGIPCSEALLSKAIDRGNTRSPIQQLKNATHGFWNIRNLNERTGKPALYQLDPRHLSGCKEQDRAARRDREIELKLESKDLAEKEGQRLPKAQSELIKALDEHQRHFDFSSEGASDLDGGDTEEEPTPIE